MPDRTGLKVVGFIFAAVTAAVMLMTVQVVKSYADGFSETYNVADTSR